MDRLHDLRPVRPMVLAEHIGVADRHKPFDPAPACEGSWERGVERSLQERIWTFEVLRDDHVVEPRVTVGWRVDATDYGVRQEVHRAEDGDRFTSYRWDAPLADLGRDFAACDRAHSRSIVPGRSPRRPGSRRPSATSCRYVSAARSGGPWA